MMWVTIQKLLSRIQINNRNYNRVQQVAEYKIDIKKLIVLPSIAKKFRK